MKKPWSILVLAALALGGCSAGSSGAYAETAAPGESMSGSSMAVDSAAPASIEPVNLNRQVIRNGSMTVRVPEVEKWEKQLIHDLSAIGGYVAASETSGYGTGSPSATLDLRVPSRQLDQFIDTVSGYGVVLNKQLSSEDVTDQLIDIGARLKTLKLQEEKYQGLLSKVSKINEIHELETRLGEIRTEIERISATEKSLLERVALSELHVTLRQDAATTAAAASQGNWFSEAWGESSGAFMGFLKGAGSFAIWMVVWSPVWGALSGVSLLVVRRSRLARSQSSQ